MQCFAWETDKEGRLQWVKEGKSPGKPAVPYEVTRSSIESRIPVVVRDQWKRSGKSQSLVNFVHPLVDRQGRTLMFSTSAVALRDKQNAFTGIRGVSRQSEADPCQDFFEGAEEPIVVVEVLCDQTSKVLSNLILKVNKAFEHLAGKPRPALEGMTLESVLPALNEELSERCGHLSPGEEPVRTELVLFNQPRRLEVRSHTPFRLTCMLGAPSKTSPRKQVDESLPGLSTSLFSAAFENCQDAILLTDRDNSIIKVNPAFTRITGYTPAEVVGKNPKILSSGRQSASFYTNMWKTLETENRWRGEMWNRKKNGEFYIENLSIMVIRNGEGQVVYYLGIFRDVSEERRHKQDLNHLTNYDQLTGLPNRRLLHERMRQAIRDSEDSGTSVAICCLDIDNFKAVNDERGHAEGDLLLVAFAQRLRDSLRKSDTMARREGDEFVLVFRNVDGLIELQEVLGRIQRSLEKPFLMGEAMVRFTASAGVTLYPADNSDPETLLRNAEYALYQAKSQGKNRMVIFDCAKHQERTALGRLVRDMERGLANDEFTLFYQPKVDLSSGLAYGAEALIRWEHPDQGLLYPNAFLAGMIDTELEIPVSSWVCRTALRELALWRKKGLKLILSINVSPRHLLQSDFLDELQTLFKEYPQLKPSDLELEILESTAIQEISPATNVIVKGKELGFHFSLDDFGTGYSSLAHFRQFPVDTLKIDRSFVQNMLTSPEDCEIVENIVRLAGAFKRGVIAEGVETIVHGKALLALGCRLGQGYGIGRPMPADEFHRWLADWQKSNPWKDRDGSSHLQNKEIR